MQTQAVGASLLRVRDQLEVEQEGSGFARSGWQGVKVKATACLGAEPAPQRSALKWLKEDPAAKAAVATRDADAARTPLQHWDAAAWASILDSAWTAGLMQSGNVRSVLAKKLAVHFGDRGKRPLRTQRAGTGRTPRGNAHQAGRGEAAVRVRRGAEGCGPRARGWLVPEEQQAVALTHPCATTLATPLRLCSAPIEVRHARAASSRLRQNLCCRW